MKLRFVQACELEVVTGFDELTETSETENEIFRIGEIISADVVETNENFQTSTIQFEDGSTVYGVPNSVFEVIDNQ